MTPEEWDKFAVETAADVLKKAFIAERYWNVSTLTPYIAAAIRSAIDVGRADECEACAKLADHMANVYANLVDRRYIEEVAVLIRARSPRRS